MLSWEITENFKNRFTFAWPTYCDAGYDLNSRVLLRIVYREYTLCVGTNGLLRNYKQYYRHLYSKHGTIHLFYVVAVHNILVKVNKLLVVYITKGKFCGIWSMATYQPRKFPLNPPGFARVKCIVLLKYIYVRFFLMLQESSACYEQSNFFMKEKNII